MAYVYMASGNPRRRRRGGSSASLEIAEYELGNTLKTGTESDHAVFFERAGYQLDTAVSFGVHGGTEEHRGGAARAHDAPPPQGSRARRGRRRAWRRSD